MGYAKPSGMTQVVELFNNTFISSAKCFSGGSTTTGSNPDVLRIKNNIFWRTSNTRTLNAVVTNPQLFIDSGRTIEIDNNIYWTNYSDPVNTYFFNTNNGSAYKTFAQWRAAYPTMDVNSFVGNPLMTSLDGSPSAWNVFPLTGSPAIGEGENLTATFTNDYAGETRPAVGVWDIGAYDTATPPPSDITAPTLLSATINSIGNQLTLEFDEPVQGVAQEDYSISGNTLGDVDVNGNTVTFSISPLIQAGAIKTLSYAQNIGDTRDFSNNSLLDFTGFSITNNSLEPTPDPAKPNKRGRGQGLMNR